MKGSQFMGKMLLQHTVVKWIFPACILILTIAIAQGQGSLSVSMTPSSDQVIAKDGSVNFDCSPSGGCSPYTFSWSFQNGMPSSSTSQMPGNVVFGGSAEGNENTITITVTDNVGATASANIKVRVPKVEIDSIPRVPIFGTNPAGTNEKSVMVMLNPTGVSINLEITTVNGSGSATFDDGSTTKNITANTTVKIRGTSNSSASNNLKFSAKLGIQTCASQTFSVRTWPVNFRQTVGSETSGILSFTYAWDAESGAVADLTGIEIGEIVTYPTGSFPNPPYNGTAPNPTVINLPGTDGSFADTHSHPPFQMPYSATSFTATQFYRFRDNVLDSTTYMNLVGPISIPRTTSQSGTNWIYEIEKSGISSSVIMP